MMNRNEYDTGISKGERGNQPSEGIGAAIVIMIRCTMQSCKIKIVTIKIKTMEVICLEDKAFYALLEQVVQHIKEKHSISNDKWISAEKAMEKLCISSKTTLQKLRDTGAVRFSQPAKKIILYDQDSIEAYLEKNVREAF